MSSSKISLFSALFAVFGLALGSNSKKWLSPVYNSLFQYPLPIPPEISPLETYRNSSSGAVIDFYQLNITAFEKRIYPDLGLAHLVGYNGISPGPTFRVQRGRQSVVRVVNGYDRPSVVHLHGSYTRPTWDGWAEDVIQPGQYKDYYYPNSNAARTMWYHDHAAGITAVNAYSGQAGFYIVEDFDVEARLGLPQGVYDIPLALASKQYTATGDLSDVSQERDSLYGDVIEVNGQPWPYLNVEPRKYRFRVLNTALSRTFMLSITKTAVLSKRGSDDDDSGNADSNVMLQIVASDAGFMSSAVMTTKLTVAMAERWEVIVDFSGFSGQNLTMKNDRNVFADDDFGATDRVMQFNVGFEVTSTANNGLIPATLIPLNKPQSGSKVDRVYKFEKSNGEYLINGVGFADVQNRVVANPARGKTEIWSLENHSGSWSHPIHIHMVDFQILSRENGRKAVEPYEQAALKDVVVLGPNERVTVAIKFAPMEGLYMFHCHNLVHEDHDMMAAFNLTSIQDLGYRESDLTFLNPLDAEWRPRLYGGTDTVLAKTELLARFAATNAYNNLTGVEHALDQYWAIHGDESAASRSLHSYHGVLLCLNFVLYFIFS